MFFIGKIVCSGIVFLSMTTWISGPNPPPLAAPINSAEEASGDQHWNGVNDFNDVKTMQQSLQDEGHYHGKIDGVLGLRTRASIRGFQKAENLPVTGQLDVGTAGKLGVRPEVSEATGDAITQEKPSAGISWANGSSRSVRKRRRPVKKLAGVVRLD